MNNNFTIRLQILLVALISAALLLVIHSLGNEYGLYWSFQWLDIVTHLLGGVSVGIITAFILWRFSFVYALIMIVAIIVAWEFFELFVAQISVNGVEFITDTATDLLLGGLSAFLLFMYTRKYF